MSDFARDLLRRANQHKEAADELFEGSFPDPKEKQRAAAIVAKITGNIYGALGEFLIHQGASVTQTETEKRRQAILERSNAIRTTFARATASGDWAEYDRLSREVLAGVSGEAVTKGSTGD